MDEKKIQQILENQERIIRENQDLKKSNENLTTKLEVLEKTGGNRAKIKKITEYDVDVRMLENKVVIGYVNKGSENRPVYVYNLPDPMERGKFTQHIDVMLEDESVIKAVQYSQFVREADRVKCRILSTKTKEILQNQGSTIKKEIDGYSLVEQNYEVPLEVKSIHRTFTVGVPTSTGVRKVILDELYCNI